MQTPHTETARSIDVKNLCSRKLFEMLSFEDELPLTRQQQHSVKAELLHRQHYLRELSTLHNWR